MLSDHFSTHHYFLVSLYCLTADNMSSVSSTPSQNVVFNGTYVYFKPCEFNGVPDSNGSIDLTFNIGQKEADIFTKVATTLCGSEPIKSTPVWTNPKNGITSVKAKVFKPAEHQWAKVQSGYNAQYPATLSKEDILSYYNQACRVTGTMRKNKQGHGGWTLYFHSMELNPNGEVIPFTTAPPVDFDAEPVDDVIPEPLAKPPTNPRKPVKITPTRVNEDAVEDGSPPIEHHPRLNHIKVKSKRATTPGEGQITTHTDLLATLSSITEENAAVGFVPHGMLRVRGYPYCVPRGYDRDSDDEFCDDDCPHNSGF